MQYNYYIFIITYFLIAAAPCDAMKKENTAVIKKKNAVIIKKRLDKRDIIGEITAVQDPYKIRCLEKDRAVILGKDRCSIVDLVENKEVQEICSITTPDYWTLKVYPHNQRILLSHGDAAVLYNIEKNIKEWRGVEQGMRSVAFSPHENILYFCYGKQREHITKYNYATEKCNYILNRKSYAIAMHPKEKVACLVNYDEGISYISLVNLDTLDTEQITASLGKVFCKYSPDGSYLAVSDGDHISIIDPSKKDKNWYSLKHKQDAILQNMVFHPNGLVLAAWFNFVTNAGLFKKILYCWDIETQQRIYTLQLHDEDMSDFDFSFNGEELIIVQQGKCIRIKVPFEVIFESDTKEKFPYHLFLLQQLINEQQDLQDVVPKEIEQYCAQLLLQAFKR